MTLSGGLDSDGVRRALAGCTALVQPSFIEGLPVVIMEAMAMRRPVISTYIAGIPELVIPGETGWLVPAGDTCALVAAMDEVIKAGEEKINGLVEAGQARVRERHSVEHEASTSRISEEQLFYLQSRGLDMEKCISMIVNGFCNEVFKELPLEFSVEAVKLLEMKLENSIG